MRLPTPAEDRQRIYTHVIHAMLGSALRYRRSVLPSSEVREGDVVVSQTRWLSRSWDPWLVGLYVGPLDGPFGGYQIQDVATGRIRNVLNDGFHVVRGLGPEALLAGHQFVGAKTARRGLRMGYRLGWYNHWDVRVAGVKFDDRTTRQGVLHLRPHSLSNPRVPSEIGPALGAVPDSEAWTVVAEWKAIPFRATSRLRQTDVAVDVAAALERQPFRYFAVPALSAKVDGHSGYPTSLADPGAITGAIEVLPD